MSRITAAEAGGQNLVAFLDMIAWSELGPLRDDPRTDDGYKVIVGSTPASPILFDDYSDHPRRLIEIRPGLKSTAAGRYQLLSRYFDPYRRLLKLSDFSPVSQDKIALQQIKECRAIPLILEGHFSGAVNRCKHIWASLPGAGYGQHEHKLERLAVAYKDAGGSLAVA